jgi:ferredoxin
MLVGKALGLYLALGPGAQAAWLAAPAGAPAGGRMTARRATAPRMDAALEQWLVGEAGISPKFVGKVLETCEEEVRARRDAARGGGAVGHTSATRGRPASPPTRTRPHSLCPRPPAPRADACARAQMVGSVDNLRTLASEGLLPSVFKPVVAASIEAALGGGGGGGGGVAGGAAVESMADTLPMGEVKRLLMMNRLETWGSDATLRARLNLVLQGASMGSGASWDAGARAWAGPKVAVEDSLPFRLGDGAPLGAGFEVPAAPSGFDGAQWAPVVAPLGAAAAPAPAKPKAAPAPAPPPAAPAPPPPPPPASDKATFTVTLKTPDGDATFECPPDLSFLDAIDELDDPPAGLDDLPYACRAGSCSACAGRVVAGQVDNSAAAFLNAEQKAAGFTLTCVAKPASDGVVIETHKEDDLY